MLSVSYVCRGFQFSQSPYDDNHFQMAGTLVNNIIRLKKLKNDKNLEKAINDDVSTLTKRHYQGKNV